MTWDWKGFWLVAAQTEDMMCVLCMYLYVSGLQRLHSPGFRLWLQSWLPSLCSHSCLWSSLGTSKFFSVQRAQDLALSLALSLHCVSQGLAERKPSLRQKGWMTHWVDKDTFHVSLGLLQAEYPGTSCEVQKATLSPLCGLPVGFFFFLHFWEVWLLFLLNYALLMELQGGQQEEVRRNKHAILFKVSIKSGPHKETQFQR